MADKLSWNLITLSLVLFILFNVLLQAKVIKLFPYHNSGPGSVPDVVTKLLPAYVNKMQEYLRGSQRRVKSAEIMQVEFLKISKLNAIQTRGRGDYNQWVTLYSVSTSMDGITWTFVLNATGSIKVFPGNVDQNTVVTNTLEGNVVAKFIRIISVSGHSHSSMRLEVKGCPVANMSSTCHKWEARQGSTGDVFSVVGDTDASNQGLCGLKCYRESECDGFYFDVDSFRCRLLKKSPDSSYSTENFDGVWYFMKK